MQIIGKCLVLLALSSGSLHAQEQFFVFPQFADGYFADGTWYRSTIMIQSWLPSPAAQCILRLNGMTSNFPNASGSLFSFTVPAGGFYQASTTGNQPFQGGYATLTCNESVFANVLYSFYSGSTKLSEATVFGVVPSFHAKLIADQREGARLGIAIANDTDIQRNYTLTLRRADGTTFSTTNLIVGARRSFARFLDELVPSSSNQILEVNLQAPDFEDFSAVGLRFTGVVFTTIPANQL